MFWEAPVAWKVTRKGKYPKIPFAQGDLLQGLVVVECESYRSIDRKWHQLDLLSSILDYDHYSTSTNITRVNCVTCTLKRGREKEKEKKEREKRRKKERTSESKKEKKRTPK